MTSFTLAEVLIVLGIIGLIADMTIPTLQQNIEEKAAVTKLQKAYSTFSNAYRMVVAESGPASEWNLLPEDPDSSNLAFDNFEPYLNLIKKCGTGEGCFPNVCYKFLNGTASDININNDNLRAKGILADGSVFAMLSGGVSITLYVDINGDKPPNQWGRDFFEFRIIGSEIIPTGTQKFNEQFETTCKDSKTQKGYYCAAWVIYNGNMDYLHCDDLSWDGQKKCN